MDHHVLDCKGCNSKEVFWNCEWHQFGASLIHHKALHRFFVFSTKTIRQTYPVFISRYSRLLKIKMQPIPEFKTLVGICNVYPACSSKPKVLIEILRWKRIAIKHAPDTNVFLA
jgi:hypothetical protein